MDVLDLSYFDQRKKLIVNQLNFYSIPLQFKINRVRETFECCFMNGKRSVPVLIFQ